MLKLLSRNRGLIGVDVGAHCVKVAQLVRRGGELVLDQAIVLERSTATNTFELNGVSELLGGCDQFSGRNAAATLSMSVCEYNSEPIEAQLDEAEVEQVARRLATRESRLSSQLQHDHWRTAGGGQDQSMLHVLSTSSHVAADLTQQHRAAGLACVALDGLPTALARAVQLAGCPDNTPIAAVDWGCSRVTICVVLRGRPVFVRSFARGTYASIVEPLCGALNLTPRESRQILTTIGLPSANQSSPATKTQAAVAQCAAAALAEFQEELGRTLSFLQGRQRAICPQHAVLFGGGATIANVAAHVGAASGLDVSVWDYPHFESRSDASAPYSPVALLGPAIALSALAWETA